jgi:endonuclease-3
MSRVLDTLAGATTARAGTSTLERISRRADPFRVLVGCIISLRTKDEVTEVAARRLLRRAPSARALAALRPQTIARLIYPAGFYNTKARVLRALALRLVREYRGRVPDSLDELLGFDGVGRKTANLVLTIGFGKPGICVDTHVHRISNRLGFVRTLTPDETEQVLRDRLPRRHWIPINELLVTFGQRTCTPLSPWCSRCPVARLCHRVGVERVR